MLFAFLCRALYVVDTDSERLVYPHPPALPRNLVLDGELWGGRDTFNRTSGKIRSLSSTWSGVIYFVFDCFPSAPDPPLPFEERYKVLENQLGPAKTPDEVIREWVPSSWTSSSRSQHLLDESSERTSASGPRPRKVVPLKHIPCDSGDQLETYVSTVLNRGGEGAMLRKAGSLYHPGRSNRVLYKVKAAYDGEAEVVGHIPFREGKWNEDRTRVGSLRCLMASGREFRVGSGLDNWFRNSAPPKGSIIKYRCADLNPALNKPRHPVFLGIGTFPDEPRTACLAQRKSPIVRFADVGVALADYIPLCACVVIRVGETFCRGRSGQDPAA